MALHVSARRAFLAALLLTLSASATFAQDGSDQPRDGATPPVFFAGGGFSRLTGATLDVGTVLPVGDQSFSASSGARTGRRGIEVAASAGAGGSQFAAGYGVVMTEGRPALTFGADLRGMFGTLNARGRSPQSAYAGVDAGYTFSFVHGSLGVAYRLKDDPNHSRLMLSATIGIVVPFGPRWC